MDQHILGYLGRALSLEFSAVQMYSTQARLVASWGLDGPAARLVAEAREEMGHVERIIDRMPKNCHNGFKRSNGRAVLAESLILAAESMNL